MPWAKFGDNFATYPKLMAAAAHGGMDMVNSLRGFIAGCATQVANHSTDYRIDVGTLYLMGAARTDEFLEVCDTVGLMWPILDGSGAWKLIADPEFIHIRSKAEIDWDRQRTADNSNPEITAPVRLRDGDHCRYCRCKVSYADRKSGRAGTYDHRAPGQPATVDTYVVACKSCNSKRKNDPAADEFLPLLPAPAEPFYSAATAAWIEKHLGVKVAVAEDIPATQPDLRTGTPALAVPDPVLPDPADPGRSSPDFQGEVSGFPGSGRVGSGPVGSGQNGSVQAGSGSPDSKRRRSARRSRRGNRGSSKPPTDERGQA